MYAFLNSISNLFVPVCVVVTELILGVVVVGMVVVVLGAFILVTIPDCEAIFDEDRES